MRIGVDLDGVVCDYHSFFIEEINLRYGKHLKLEDWTDYNFSNSGFSQEELENTIKDHSERGYFAHIPAIPGALYSLRKLDEDNSIHIISKREGNSKKDGIDWLNLRDVPYDTINFTKNKGMIAGRKGIDYMIEDDHRYIPGFQARGIVTLLYDKPWNRDFDDYFRIHRVKNWREIMEVLGYGQHQY